MKKMIVSLVAALTLGGAVSATSAVAQEHHDRTVVRTTHTTVVRRAEHVRGHHRHRVCRTVWRHHKRIRTCRTW